MSKPKKEYQKIDIRFSLYQAINLPNTTKLNFEDVIAEACKEWLNENLELLNNRILSSTSLDLIRYEYEKLIEGCNK